MPQAQVASSHHIPDGTGDARKILINLYAEKADADPARPFKLAYIPGSIDADPNNNITDTIRGVVQTDGHAGGAILINDGDTVRTHQPEAGTWGALSGTVIGSGRVQWAFSENEGACLSDGTPFISTGTSIATASDGDYTTLLVAHGQGGFTSIASLGQRLLLTYGSRFAFSNALDFNNTTALSYYTAESHPDGVVAGVVLGREYYLFGTRVIEPWAETGDDDDPFAPILGREIPTGCLCRDAICEVDNTLVFVAADFSVRRINGAVAEIISEPWLVRKLKTASVASMLARRYNVENHDFYVLNTDVGCFVWDAATGEWHQRQTYNKDVWDWAYLVSKNGHWYAGERSGSRFARLDRAYNSEYGADADTFGAEVLLEFTAHMPSLGGRPAIPSIRLDGRRGIGSSRNRFEDGKVWMRLSKDNGNTWGPWRERSTGAQGEYGTRIIWRQNGRARDPQVIAHFRTNDRLDVTAVMINED